MYHALRCQISKNRGELRCLQLSSKSAEDLFCPFYVKMEFTTVVKFRDLLRYSLYAMKEMHENGIDKNKGRLGILVFNACLSITMSPNVL